MFRKDVVAMVLSILSVFYVFHDASMLCSMVFLDVVCCSMLSSMVFLMLCVDTGCSRWCLRCRVTSVLSVYAAL